MDALQARITPEKQPSMEDSFESSALVKVSEQLGKEIGLAVTPSCFFVELIDDITEQATRQSVAPSLLKGKLQI